MAYTINIGSRNIKFVSGTNYKVGASLIIAVASSVQFDGDVTGASVSAMINAGKFTVVSGTINEFSNSPEVVYLNTTSVGFVAQVENNIATLAARDVEIVKRVLHESARVDAQEQQITALETAAAGKAVIDDTSTGTDKVLSAAKTIERISDAQTAAQKAAETFATTAASNAQAAAETFAAAAINNLVAGAPAALDTLKEIADKIAADETSAAALVSTVGEKVSYAAVQSLSAGQKVTARTNIGAISTDDATTIANDRITAVIGDPATLSTAAIFASFAIPPLF